MGETAIQFAGLRWTVRNGAGGPGPNDWNPNNVSVDSSGNLHLQVTYRNGRWTTAEITTDAPLGFGTYQVQLATPVDKLDRNLVLGFFSYPSSEIGPDGTNEIDIEFSTWGGHQTNYGNWTVWPAKIGTAVAKETYAVPSDAGGGTYRFIWSSQSIHFESLAGHSNGAAGEYQSWNFAPANPPSAIPQQAEPFHMNLWLFGGRAPANGETVDVVVTGFSFTPQGQATAIGPSAPASDAVQAFNSNASLAKTQIADSAANITLNLDRLEPLSAAGKLSGITLTDGGAPNLSISARQLAQDLDVLQLISGNFTLKIAAQMNDAVMSGLAGHGTVASFEGNSSQYAFAPATGGGFTISSAGHMDHLANILQVAFADKTITVADLNSPNEYVALLYQAALGRTPDLVGLQGWDEFAAGPTSSSHSTLAIAHDFMSSAEFKAKYGTLDDLHFVNQLYSNILDRAPDPAGLAGWLGELGSGQTREQILIGFAESAEAISNAAHGFVGQSGTHPAWLFLT